MKAFFFGLGYCARRFIARQAGVEASGTVRSEAAAAALRAEGVAVFRFDGETWDPALEAALRTAEAIVVSIPASPPGGDAALRHFSGAIAAAAALRRILYLSTIGVYGDHGGAWVDETCPARALSARGLARLEAEAKWAMLGATHGVPVDILRLAGIYGPGRNILEKLAQGAARRIVKPGHVFNRAHVDDIASMMRLILAAGRPGEIWNVADDEPASPQDVLAYGAQLLGVAPPPEERFDPATMSPMSASFYADNKRVSIDKAKRLLGFHPAYPSYREGLEALAAAGEGLGD